MNVITITIGRNRRPGSEIAPFTPLSAGDWLRFRVEILEALEPLTGPKAWTETHYGEAEWEGVKEESAKVTVLGAWTDAAGLATLRNRLRNLAAQYDQDAIAVSVGTSDLVLSQPRVPVAA